VGRVVPAAGLWGKLRQVTAVLALEALRRLEAMAGENAETWLDSFGMAAADVGRRPEEEGGTAAATATTMVAAGRAIPFLLELS